MGQAEIAELARKYGVSERHVARISRGARPPRKGRLDARRDREYLDLLGESLVLWIVGQLDEGVAIRDAVASAHDCDVPRAERLGASPYRLQRALTSQGYQVTAMRKAGAIRPDGSRAPMVKRRVERIHPNSLHQYDETRAPCMYVDERDGYVCFDPEMRIDWEKRQKGKSPLWVAGTLDDVSRARWFVPIPTPCAEAVLEALSEAWLPKDDPRAPLEGLPEQVYGDNGSWLNSETVRAALEALGVKLALHRPYHPEAKGKIERAFLAACSLWAQERLCRSSVEVRGDGQSVRRVLRMRGDEVRPFFLRLNLLWNNRINRETGEEPFERWLNLVTRWPECLRAAPPREVFHELALARLLKRISPAVTLDLPGGEKVGLDYSVFGELVGTEVEIRFRRRERDRPVLDGERVIVIAGDRRWEVARRPPVLEHRLDYREQPVTSAERLSIAARRVDYSGQDLTRHAEASAPERPLPVAPIPFDASRIAEIVGRRMLQIGRFEALERLQQAGVFSRPLSEEDKRRAAAWLGASEVVNLDVVDHIARSGAPPAGAAAEASAG
jgi:transposase InsO family protein